MDFINTYTLPERQSIECTRETLRATLDKFGVAVISNVLTPVECEAMKEGQHKTIAELTSLITPPFDVADPSTYGSVLKTGALHGMIFQNSGVGHSKHAWDIRQNKEVVGNFAALWETDPADLRCSMDAIAAWYPQKNPETGTNKNNDWMHVDQAPLKHERESVQSWVTGETVGVGDATITVLLGGHAYHMEFHEKFGTVENKDWLPLSNEQLEFYRGKGCKLLSITCSAGSQVFFDSRTPHQGTLPHRDRAVKDRIRCIVYVCMTPVSAADFEWRKDRKEGKYNKVFVGLERRKKMDAKRVALFKVGQNTSHCPHNFRSFPISPFFRGKPTPLKNIVPREEWLTPLGRKIIGFE